MAPETVRSRQAYRRTDDFTPGTSKIRLVTEELPELEPTAVLIKVHAVALNYRDANIANGGNPWPVIPNGILCNDAAGEVLEVGNKVSTLVAGDRCAPILDTEYISARSTGRSWLAANEDGVMATHIIFDEKLLAKLPSHLSWVDASIIPCAGTTAWSALKDVGCGKTVLIQGMNVDDQNFISVLRANSGKGTGGVSMFALKLARVSGLAVILSSSSDEKLDTVKQQFGNPPIATVNYRQPNWHERVLELTNGIGVDLVIENGGTPSLVQSMKCTRRGGIVSQVGYLGKQDPKDLEELVSTIIDRRLILRGINGGSRDDLEDLCHAIATTKLQLDDIIDSVFSWGEAEEALQYLWEGKQVGKLVIDLDQ